MSVQIITGDCIESMRSLPDNSIQACITSPPYFGLRSYAAGEKEVGVEQIPTEYISKVVSVFCEVNRLLCDDGTLWLNLGDSYANDGKWGGHTGGKHARALHGTPIGRNKKYTGHKPKDLMGMPWRIAIALQDSGWYLRAACPWIKRNGMPDSVKDRPTQCVETMFMLTKTDRCYYDYEAVKKMAKDVSLSRLAQDVQNQTGSERANAGDKTNGNMKAVGGIKRARRTSDNFFESWQGLWPDEEGEPLAFVVNTKGFKGAHFATFPPKLIEPCVLASTKPGDTILDPFGGSGTTGMVAQQHGRSAILCELNPDYATMAAGRCGIMAQEDWS